MKTRILLALASAATCLASEAAAGTTYSYDLAGRVVRASDGSLDVTYTYDALGNVVRRCESGSCVDVVTDDAQPNAAVVGEINASGQATLYGYGPQGYAAVKAADGTVRRPLAEARGNVRALISAQGGIDSHITYDSFGRERSHQNVTSTTNNLGYRSEFNGASDGLVWLRARSYSPDTGRFLQRDSFGGFLGQPQSANRFAYAEGNPVSNSDPSGHFIWAIVGAGLAVAALAPLLYPDPTAVDTTDPETRDCEQSNLDKYNGLRSWLYPLSLASSLILPFLGPIAGAAGGVGPELFPGAGAPEAPELPLGPTEPGEVPLGQVHPSWLNGDGTINQPLFKKLSDQLNTIPPGDDVRLRTDAPPVLTEGPTCNIYGTCGTISDKVPMLIRKPASEVLGNGQPYISARDAAESPPSLSLEPGESIQYGDYHDFARGTPPGTVGDIGSHNFGGNPGPMSDHQTNIVQTPFGPQIVDVQRGGQTYGPEAFPNGIVTYRQRL